MSVDPRTSMIFNSIMLALNVLAGASWWTDLVGNKTAAIVTGVMGTAAAIINQILSAYSSSKPGFLARE